MSHNQNATESETKYETLRATAEQLTDVLKSAVIDPIAKQHFEDDRGLPVTQVLPDRTDDYHFNAHGFEADVIPDERSVINHSFDGNSISPAGFTRHPRQFAEIVEAGEEVWIETFGPHKQHINQPYHPGPFPLQDTEFETSVTQLVSLYEDLIEAKSLSLALKAVREEDYSLLAEIFGTEEADILNPSGSDLSPLALMDSIAVPYNDDSIALIRPETERNNNIPTRGVIIGHDDTPVGIFAHVTDVTNLEIGQTITLDSIQDAMGFDRELNPWAETTDLQIGDEERVRIQGDLRVERTGDVANFPAELARNTRVAEYESRIESQLQQITVSQNQTWGRQSDMLVSDLVSVTASPDGEIVLNTRTGSGNLELLAYATVLREFEVGPAQQYEEYADIPYTSQGIFGLAPSRSIEDPVSNARAEAHETLTQLAADHQIEVEQEAQEVAAEARAITDVPRQVNLPIDNHLAFIKAGFAPDAETEPVPVAVPDPTTLHIVHSEHNTVTVEIAPGVYRFSLLPRGLQPMADRPQWPEE